MCVNLQFMGDQAWSNCTKLLPLRITCNTIFTTHDFVWIYSLCETKHELQDAASTANHIQYNLYNTWLCLNLQFMWDLYRYEL